MPDALTPPLNHPASGVFSGLASPLNATASGGFSSPTSPVDAAAPGVLASLPRRQLLARSPETTAPGLPLPAVFARFDPQPIASTSVACTYQAVLHNGEEVIVRARRPGIGPAFMAGVQAFDWILTLAELLTIFRPGLTKGLRGEF